MRFLGSQLFERIIYVLAVAGVLIGLYSIAQIANMSYRISQNPAQQFHESGEELDVEATTAPLARGLVAADVELRQLIRSRAQMVVAMGVSLVLIGLAWFGYDLMKGQRKKLSEQPEKSKEQRETSATT